MSNDSYFGQDTRRRDRGNKKYNHFKNGKHVPRTNKDRLTEVPTRKKYLCPENFELSLNRAERKEWAQETVTIMEQKFLNDSFISQTIYYPEETSIPFNPEDYPDYDPNVYFIETKTVDFLWKINPSNLPTLAVLNFASAKNPGGGFLKGASGQEESLAVSSGLYWSIKDQEMYSKNQKDPKNSVYRSDAIWSPQVPLFRFGDGTVTKQIDQDHRRINVISMPAVNYRSYTQKKSFSEATYDRIMRERISKVFEIALLNGMDQIILGPWGCGVFEGDLDEMIQRFQDDPLHAKFKKIYFLSNFAFTVENMEEVWRE